jgi:hypothetical protein
MNKEKTILKLKELTDEELDWLLTAIHNEKSENRMKFMSNKKHSGNDMANNLSKMFGNAWIH